MDCGYKLADHPSDLTRDQILFLTAAMGHRMEQVRTAKLAADGVTRIVVAEGEEEE